MSRMHLGIPRVPIAVAAAACLTVALLLTQAVPAEAAAVRHGRAVVAGYSGEQLANARIIVAVAAARHLPVAAAVLGVATAMGESGLRNLSYGDNAINPDGTIADSVGLFQQQHWWGSKAERMTPVYAAAAFFAHLGRVPGWEQRTPTAAIHAVQRNADPRYYTRFLPAAADVVRFLVSHPGAAVTSGKSHSTWASSSSKITVPKIRIPKITIPTITIPTITVPDLTAADITAPEGTPSDGTASDGTAPNGTAPTTTTPTPAPTTTAADGTDSSASADATPLTAGDLGLAPLDPIDLGDWATGWDIGSIDEAISGAFADGLGSSGGTLPDGSAPSTDGQ